MPELVAAGKSLVPTLIETLRYGTEMLEERSADLLIEIGAPAVLPILELFLLDPSSVGKGAVRILKALNDPRSVEPLIGFLKQAQKTDARVPYAIRVLVATGDIR